MAGMAIGLGFGISFAGGGVRPPAGFTFITAMNPDTGNRELVKVINPSNGLREPIAVRIAA